MLVAVLLQRSLCPGVRGRLQWGHSQRWGHGSSGLSSVSQTQLLIKPGCKWSGDN